MFTEHKRANTAYKAIENFLDYSVDLPEDLHPPELTDFSPRIYDQEKKLHAIGPIEDDIKRQLKALSDYSKWHEVIDDLIKEEHKKKKKFDSLKTWAMKFPSMLLTCGLLQTAGFYEEKSKDVYNMLQGWLFKQDIIPWPDDTINGLVSRVSKLDAAQMGIYRMAAREAMAYMTWVKRAVAVKLP